MYVTIRIEFDILYVCNLEGRGLRSKSDHNVISTVRQRTFIYRRTGTRIPKLKLTLPSTSDPSRGHGHRCDIGEEEEIYFPCQ